MFGYISTVWLTLAAFLGTPTGPEHTATLSTTTPVACQIKIDTEGSRKVITAIARAQDTPKAGHFLLEIEKTGTNTMKTRQGGDFAVQAGETLSLATVKMNMSAADALKGTLSLNWDGGSASCPLN